jgi:hypothetical protein
MSGEKKLNIKSRKAPLNILNKIAAEFELTGRYKKERDGENDWDITLKKPFRGKY